MHENRLMKLNGSDGIATKYMDIFRGNIFLGFE